MKTRLASSRARERLTRSWLLGKPQLFLYPDLQRGLSFVTWGDPSHNLTYLNPEYSVHNSAKDTRLITAPYILVCRPESQVLAFFFGEEEPQWDGESSTKRSGSGGTRRSGLRGGPLLITACHSLSVFLCRTIRRRLQSQLSRGAIVADRASQLGIYVYLARVNYKTLLMIIVHRRLMSRMKLARHTCRRAIVSRHKLGR